MIIIIQRKPYDKKNIVIRITRPFPHTLNPYPNPPKKGREQMLKYTSEVQTKQKSELCAQVA